MATAGSASSVYVADELELLTPADVAKLFKVPVSWVYNATRKRSNDPMPHIKIGIYTRFQEAAVRDWFEKRKRGYRHRAHQ